MTVLNWLFIAVGLWMLPGTIVLIMGAFRAMREKEIERALESVERASW